MKKVYNQASNLNSLEGEDEPDQLIPDTTDIILFAKSKKKV